VAGEEAAKIPDGKLAIADGEAPAGKLAIVAGEALAEALAGKLAIAAGEVKAQQLKASGNKLAAGIKLMPTATAQAIDTE
jgi:putative Ca2+/H+ antiporter (TMEM165/GDT1 family)